MYFNLDWSIQTYFRQGDSRESFSVRCLRTSVYVGYRWISISLAWQTRLNLRLRRGQVFQKVVSKFIPVNGSGDSSTIVSTSSTLPLFKLALPSLGGGGVINNLQTEFGMIDGERQTKDKGITSPRWKFCIIWHWIEIKYLQVKDKKVSAPPHLLQQSFGCLEFQK